MKVGDAPGVSADRLARGEVVDVEPGEAEFLLDVLELTLDFYFVAPAQAAAKREAINAKLKEAGKPPLKT